MSYLFELPTIKTKDKKFFLSLSLWTSNLFDLFLSSSLSDCLTEHVFSWIFSFLFKWVRFSSFGLGLRLSSSSRPWSRLRRTYACVNEVWPTFLRNFDLFLQPLDIGLSSVDIRKARRHYQSDHLLSKTLIGGTEINSTTGTRVVLIGSTHTDNTKDCTLRRTSSLNRWATSDIYSPETCTPDGPSPISEVERFLELRVLFLVHLVHSHVSNGSLSRLKE